MTSFPKALKLKLESRGQNQALRMLPKSSALIDFSSNDYLGFSRCSAFFHETHQHLIKNNCIANGATGSRLLTGNHFIYQETEKAIALFHNCERALIYNSGYAANIGFFSVVPQKKDIILFDELCHASIRDGIKMSNAKAYKFKHNDYGSLEKLLIKFSNEENEIYIVTESVFSMDGDSPDLNKMVLLSKKYNGLIVVDEAHALGIIGDKGEGLTQSLGLHKDVFARIITFGKSMGCHGAAILCSLDLKSYLVNFSRSFIYTTGLSPHSVASILIAYKNLEDKSIERQRLSENITFFVQQAQQLKLNFAFNPNSPIQTIIIPGNKKVKEIALELQKENFDVKPILSPTVPEGKERLRFCLHSYNSEKEIKEVLVLLSSLL